MKLYFLFFFRPWSDFTILRDADGEDDVGMPGLESSE